MGGEKYQALLDFRRNPGSPPHGRGKVLFTVEFLLGSGITPAWEGKSSQPTQKSGTSGDHPRMGGEK